MVIFGKIGIYMSYLIYIIGYKANKCSCFSSKKWQRGLENFGNGDIISPLVRRGGKKFHNENRPQKVCEGF